MNNPQQQFNVDISQTTEVVCEQCGNTTFNHVFQLRKLSALLSPAGQETMIPMQVFACAKCNHINKDFLPKDEDDTI
jgi:DNA-directed RNA polymerase subunit RPC12/RpoP